jgi:glycosyltransferase involved in cell wall biosynthesis
MNICIVTTIHPPYEARILERCAVPLSRSHLVTIVAPWEKLADCSNIRFVSLEFPKTRLGRIFHGYRIFLQAWKQKSDIYHFHDLDFLPWALILKAVSRSIVIYDCHENYPEEILYGKPWIPEVFRKVLAKTVEVLENFAIKRFDAVVVVVESQVERFKKLNLNTTLIQNLSVYESNYDLHHQENVLYTGSISKSYGSDVLIDIARKIKHHQRNYIIYTFDKFDDSMKENFLQIVNDENLPLKTLPRFSRSEIMNIMSLGCIGLSLEQDTINKKMAIPAKLFEYMSFGLPVIASNLPNNANIINVSQSGILVAPDSASEFFENIELLMNDILARDILKKNGFRAIQNDFNWKNEEEKLINLYKKLSLKGML